MEKTLTSFVILFQKNFPHIDQLGHISGLQVPEDRGLIEEGEVRHVVTLLKLGRVDLGNLVTLHGLLLQD